MATDDLPVDREKLRELLIEALATIDDSYRLRLLWRMVDALGNDAHATVFDEIARRQAAVRSLFMR